MKQRYHYVVLRLKTNDLRNEIINVGIILFDESLTPKIITMAPLNKLRAIDTSWDMARLSQWMLRVQDVIEMAKNAKELLSSLDRFGYCDQKAIGMFMASSQRELAENISDIKRVYVANKSGVEREPREKKSKLQILLKEQFERMQLLGSTINDLANHLVVPNVQVPEHPGLRSDFLFKNGVYRITQTIDYNVAPDSLHNKLSEACVKSTAADLAVNAYGKETKKFAVVDIPEAFVESVDSHLDLLHTKGFEIFHYSNPASISDYFKKTSLSSF